MLKSRWLSAIASFSIPFLFSGIFQFGPFTAQLLAQPIPRIASYLKQDKFRQLEEILPTPNTYEPPRENPDHSIGNNQSTMLSMLR